MKQKLASSKSEVRLSEVGLVRVRAIYDSVVHFLVMCVFV